MNAMTRYVALLRGINVGGIRIRMADLAEVFSAAGHRDVRTVLASGNVLFDSDDDATALEAALEAALTDRFGYDAYTFVVEQSRVADLVAAYPFDDRDDHHSYVVFVSDPGVLDALAGAESLGDGVERVQRGDGVLYWQVEKGRTLDSNVGKRSGDGRYKSVTTARNLKTLRKLL
ncbi:Uncharacterized protein conserved in bacteria [Rhodococcus coprophilus]|uniref:Uncharacterized protein conserved in bacteria n=2 Tax=Rhodococcus coprophilus TaxID=38310 RepID=A0A2X4UII2_9NOCA|nr:Uncharacterized protein conserved in bacteria [Rhodococcus coprophilus]